jgi:hypothetical protein
LEQQPDPALKKNLDLQITFDNFCLPSSAPFARAEENPWILQVTF